MSDFRPGDRVCYASREGDTLFSGLIGVVSTQEEAEAEREADIGRPTASQVWVWFDKLVKVGSSRGFHSFRCSIDMLTYHLDVPLDSLDEIEKFLS